MSGKFTVIDVIESLLAERLLSPEAVARTTGKVLNADRHSSDRPFAVFRSDPDVRSDLQTVELRVPAQAGALVVLSVNATPCISPSMVTQRFGTQPEVNVQETAAPYGFAYRYNFSGRSVSFAFSRENECLMEVVIDSTEAQSAVPSSVGSATMSQDGTIVLDLRAEGPGVAIGDARAVYPRGHRQYDEVLRHVGGPQPGENKPVPPWPEDQSQGNGNWLGFTPYPGAREICHQFVDGRDGTGPVGIEWRSYGTRDDTALVIAFYAKTGGKNMEQGENSITLRQGKSRILSAHAASASGYPTCENKPRPEEKTIIIVSQRNASE